MDAKQCNIENCTNRVLARGWCSKHWQRWNLYGDPCHPLPVRMTTICEAPNCVQKSSCRYEGVVLCNLHWQRMKRYNSLENPERPPSWAICTVSDCNNPARSRYSTICEKHYYRRRRTGNVKDRSTAPFMPTSNGYMSKKDHVHPASSPGGNLLEHRKVLYDAIGDGIHWCHWCDSEITWIKGGKSSKGSLIVDHLDNNKSNNALSNLVPSCHWCNTSRAAVYYFMTRNLNAYEYCKEIINNSMKIQDLLEASGDISYSYGYRSWYNPATKQFKKVAVNVFHDQYVKMHPEEFGLTHEDLKGELSGKEMAIDLGWIRVASQNRQDASQCMLFEGKDFAPVAKLAKTFFRDQKGTTQNMILKADDTEWQLVGNVAVREFCLQGKLPAPIIRIAENKLQTSSLSNIMKIGGKNSVNDELLEMANLPTEDTGVRGIIYISTAMASHGPRVKYFIKPGKDQPSFSVSIANPPTVLANSLPKPTLNKMSPFVIKWVELNQEALLTFWNDGTSWTRQQTNQFIDGLKKL